MLSLPSMVSQPDGPQGAIPSSCTFAALRASSSFTLMELARARTSISFVLENSCLSNADPSPSNGWKTCLRPASAAFTSWLYRFTSLPVKSRLTLGVPPSFVGVVGGLPIAKPKAERLPDLAGLGSLGEATLMTSLLTSPAGAVAGRVGSAPASATSSLLSARGCFGSTPLISTSTSSVSPATFEVASGLASAAAAGSDAAGVSLAVAVRVCASAAASSAPAAASLGSWP
mmetsp:Transcript_57363/g.136351  ORF Transcript_57363/g.136351 Transcript_57363/m.136351 type:complete len:230 (-) Transcript_57363:119-808(-)